MSQFNYWSAVIFILLWTGAVSAQNAQNVSLLYQFDDPNITRYSDVWGYEDNGTEIAIIASRDSFIFLDITDHNQVQVLPSVAPGGSTNWRDIKCHGKYCYGITDVQAGEGLTVINMDSILNGTATFHSITTEFNEGHNLFIDEATDKLYVVGADQNSGGYYGYIVYDLSADPYNPTHLATVNLSSYLGCTNSYLHDVFVRNDTLYGNAIYSGCGYHILEVSNPSSPVYIGGLPGSTFQNGYNHSNWVTDDGNYAVVAEETHGNPIHIVDLTDPTDPPPPIATWKDPLESGETNNIAHNPIIKGNYAYISYYHDGLCVLDISDPYNPVRVAYYDTYSNTGYTGYEGAWGVYPLLPSGRILVSDRSNGLHVLEVSQSVLPVDWIVFEATDKGKHSFHVKGSFQATRDLDHAELLWSSDGAEFQNAGSLSVAKGLNGVYSFEQEFFRPSSRSFFIKVKTTEIDGFIEYSEVRKVNGLTQPTIGVYPNPVKDHFWVENANGFDFTLLSMDGKPVLSGRVQSDRYQINFSKDLNEGLYFLELNSPSTGDRYTQRIMISL